MLQRDTASVVSLAWRHGNREAKHREGGCEEVSDEGNEAGEKTAQSETDMLGAITITSWRSWRDPFPLPAWMVCVSKRPIVAVVMEGGAESTGPVKMNRIWP